MSGSTPAFAVLQESGGRLARGACCSFSEELAVDEAEEDATEDEHAALFQRGGFTVSLTFVAVAEERMWT